MPVRTLAEFTETTLIASGLIVLPISIAMLLLAKTVNGLLALLAAVTAQVPAGAAFCQIVAILLLVAVCLIVRTSAGEFVRAMKQPAVLPGANPAPRVES